MSRTIFQSKFDLLSTEEQAAELAKWEARRAEALNAIDEQNRTNPSSFKKSRTTYGLTKRDATLYWLKLHPDYKRGQGQARLDAAACLPYSTERLSSSYNAGYYAGRENAGMNLNDGKTVPTVEMTAAEIATAKDAWNVGRDAMVAAKKELK